MEKIKFVIAFRACACQLATYAIAGEWARLASSLGTLTAAEAACWADLGYLPAEAEPLIRDGITAAMTAEMECHAEEVAGGRDALAAQRIEQMLGAGD